MIVLADEGQPLDIPRTEAGEDLAGLELDIDLVPHEAAQLVDLLAVVDRNPDATVDHALWGHRFRRHAEGEQDAVQGKYRGPDSLTHGASPSPPTGRREPRARSENPR